MLIESKKFREFLETRDLAEQTLDKYYRIGLWFAERYDVENPASISEFMSTTDRRFSEKFALKYLYEFLNKRKIYRQWAAENKGKFQLQPRKHERKHVGAEELHAVISVMPMPYSLMGLMQYNGTLRGGSLFKIMMGDVYTEANGDVFVNIHEKGGESFRLWLMPEIATMVKSLIPKGMDAKVAAETSLFASEKVYLQSYNRALHAASMAILKYSISSHWLRTSRAIHLLQSGVPFVTVSQVALRHKKVETTMIYAKSAGTDTKELYAKVGGLT